MRSLRLVLVLVVLLESAAQADEGIPPTVVQAIKAATVFVKVKVEGGSGSGSGFVVKTEGADTYVVTNHHVIEPKLVELLLVPDARPVVPPPTPRHSIGPRPHYLPPPSPHLLPPSYTPRLIERSFKNAAVTAVFYSGTKNEQAIPAQVLAADPERDLAILKLSGVKEPPKPIDYRREPLAETMPVCTFGFPFGEVLAMSKGSPAITVGKGSISSLRLGDDGELALVQIDGAMNPGNSGGPVVDAQGRLVAGVAVATIKNSSGIGLAIPVRELAQMFQGRLGKVYLHPATNDRGVVEVQVEAALIDPFHKIKSVGLRYLDASRIADKPKPNEPIAALAGCRTLPLKIENQVAVGKIPLAKGITQLTILHQLVYVSGSGKQAVTDSLVETVQAKAEEVAKTTEKNPPATAARELPENGPTAPSRRGSPTPRPPSHASSVDKRSSPTEKNLSGLVADLRSGDMGRRIRATLQLDGIKPQKPHPDMAKALEMVLLEDGHGFLRFHAATLLKTWGTPLSIPALKKAARDPETYVRDGARDAIEAITFAAEHPDGATSGPKTAQRGGPRGQAGGRAGGATPLMEDLDIVLADLRSNNVGRRLHALVELERAKPQEPHPEVAKALETVLREDGNLNVRVRAVLALKMWGTPENIPALETALKDRETSAWAKQAIEAIKGK